MSDDQALQRVAGFLDSDGHRLLGLLENLRTFFKTYSHSREGVGKIYRIYSRADKQGGNREFKDTWKIAQKMTEGSSPDEINDIVGITIVCPFTSDLDNVARLIETGSSFCQQFIQIGEKQEHQSAYRAIHYVVAKRQERRIRCEVQLKTVFHDSWAVKAHDMIYKPEGLLDPRFEDQMATLSSILSALERQTDIIKGMIDEHLHFDRDKKETARKRLVTQFSKSLHNLSDTDENVALKALNYRLAERQSSIDQASPGDLSLVEIEEEISLLGKKYGYGPALCRLAAAFVVSRPTDDCLYIAQDAIDRWKTRVKDRRPYPQSCPYHFSGIILYSCGHTERAAREADYGLSMRERFLGPEPTDVQAFATALSTAAYYYAELGIGLGPIGPNTDPIRAQAGTRAKEYIEKALALSSDVPSIMDTQGFVRIAFATSEDEVEEGLQLCKSSWELYRTHPDKAEISDLYYRIHKRAAFKKALLLGTYR